LKSKFGKFNKNTKKILSALFGLSASLTSRDRWDHSDNARHLTYQQTGEGRKGRGGQSRVETESDANGPKGSRVRGAAP